MLNAAKYQEQNNVKSVTDKEAKKSLSIFKEFFAQLKAKRKLAKEPKNPFKVRGYNLLVPHYTVALALLWTEGKQKMITQWSMLEYPNATEYALHILKGTESAEHAQLMLDQMTALWNVERRKLFFYNYIESLSVVLSRGLHTPEFKYSVDNKVEEVYKKHLGEFKKLRIEAFEEKKINASIPITVMARMITGLDIFCKIEDIELT